MILKMAAQHIMSVLDTQRTKLIVPASSSAVAQLKLTASQRCSGACKQALTPQTSFRIKMKERQLTLKKCESVS